MPEPHKYVLQSKALFSSFQRPWASIVRTCGVQVGMMRAAVECEALIRIGVRTGRQSPA